MSRMRDLLSTTRHDPNATLTFHGSERDFKANELIGPYQDLVSRRRLSWTTHHRLGKLLGSGGQGRVFLSECRGTDQFTVPVALKVVLAHRAGELVNARSRRGVVRIAMSASRHRLAVAAG